MGRGQAGGVSSEGRGQAGGVTREGRGQVGGVSREGRVQVRGQPFTLNGGFWTVWGKNLENLENLGRSCVDTWRIWELHTEQP